LRLPEQLLLILVVAAARGQDQLDRQLAIELRIVSRVHGPHPAATDHVEDQVATEQVAALDLQPITADRCAAALAHAELGIQLRGPVGHRPIIASNRWERGRSGDSRPSACARLPGSRTLAWCERATRRPPTRATRRSPATR